MPMLHGIGGLLCESELETEGAKFCCCKLQTVILDFYIWIFIRCFLDYYTLVFIILI